MQNEQELVLNFAADQCSTVDWIHISTRDNTIIICANDSTEEDTDEANDTNTSTNMILNWW